MILFNFFFLWAALSMMCYCIGSRIKNNLILLLFFPILCIPVLYFPFNIFEERIPLKLILAILSSIYILKTISFFYSANRFQISYIRYYLFLFYAPGLDFETSLNELDFKNNTLKKSFFQIFEGIIQILGSVFIYIIIVYYVLFSTNLADIASTDFWIIIILKSLYVYFAFAGIANIVSGYYKAWGYKVENTINHPYLSRSPRDFWKRFNNEYRKWSLKYICQPLKKTRFSSQFLYSITPFIISCAISLYVFLASGIALRDKPGENLLFQEIDWSFLCISFFIINGFFVYFEKTMLKIKYFKKDKLNDNFIMLSIKILLTLTLIIFTNTLLFEVSDRLFIY